MIDDPFVVAARRILVEALAELRRSLDGVPAEGLNWRPLAEDTNSLTALAVHSLTSTLSWLCVAFGERLPDRNRDSEFLTSASDPTWLQAFVAQRERKCLALFDNAAAFDGHTLRQTHERPDPSLPSAETAAWALVHPLEHLREHVGQMLLTRQLWEQSAGV